MEPGFYDILNNDYHAGEGLSSSGIKKLLRSPAHYRTPSETTKAMAFGSALHTYVLEPEKFESEYTVMPDNINKRTNAGKAQLEALTALNKPLIEFTDYETIIEMKKALEANRTASFLLFDQDVVYEQAGYWTDPLTGIQCKCKPDVRIDKPRIIVDLKTTGDASQDEFNHSIQKYGYFISAAHYCLGLTTITKQIWDKFIIVAVEKTPPYGVATYTMSPEWLNLGEILCKKAYKIYAECKKFDTWQCYPDRAENVYPPLWVAKQITGKDEIL